MAPHDGTHCHAPLLFAVQQFALDLPLHMHNQVYHHRRHHRFVCEFQQLDHIADHIPEIITRHYILKEAQFQQKYSTLVTVRLKRSNVSVRWYMHLRILKKLLRCYLLGCFVALCLITVYFTRFSLMHSIMLSFLCSYTFIISHLLCFIISII